MTVDVLDKASEVRDEETLPVAALDAWLAGRTALLLGHDEAALPRCDRYWRLVPGQHGAQLLG